MDWTGQDRKTMCAASCLIASVWPEMLAELAVTVRQVMVLDGPTLSSFSDFGTYGAIFVNRRQFSASNAGLPDYIRLAELLVHEGTPVRINAAGNVVPLVVNPADTSVLVRAPLRRDPRPLNGLFHQLMVLTRCWALYKRLATADAIAEQARPAVLAQRDHLREQGRAAAATLHTHRAALTERGAAAVEEASAVLDGAEMVKASTETGAP